MFVIAQLFSGVAAFFMLMSLLGTRDERFLKLQSIDCICNALADLILHGYTGLILCINSLVRNNLQLIEEWLGKKLSPFVINGIFLSLAFIVGTARGEWVWVVITSIAYTLVLKKFGNREDGALKVDAVLALDLACWMCYDLKIHSYPMAVIDGFSLVRALFIVWAEASDEQIITVGGSKSASNTKFGEITNMLSNVFGLNGYLQKDSKVTSKSEDDSESENSSMTNAESTNEPVQNKTTLNLDKTLDTADFDFDLIADEDEQENDSM